MHLQLYVLLFVAVVTAHRNYSCIVYVYLLKIIVLVSCAGCSGLVATHPTTVHLHPRIESHCGQFVYYKNHCDIQLWAWAVHPYCNA